MVLAHLLRSAFTKRRTYAKTRLMAFHDLMESVGMGRFGKKERVREDSHVCHFRIMRCTFHDFFSETGTQKLTKLFCEVDRQLPKGFPRFNAIGDSRILKCET